MMKTKPTIIQRKCQCYCIGLFVDFNVVIAQVSILFIIIIVWREMSQQMNEENRIDIEAEGENYQEEEEMIQAQEFLQELQQQSQRMIEKLDKEQGVQNVEVEQVAVKNPVSPYMMFIKMWKISHPQEKFNLSNLGQIWKSMSLSEKQPYQAEFLEKKQQYELHQATLQMSNLNNPSSEANNPKYFFPLARVRAIMKQDSFYAPKVEATTAMAKAVEYFTEYILEETKKITEGQHRIDAKALFDCINNNRSMSFLQCLIEEYNKESNEGNKQKKPKPSMRLEFEPTGHQKIEKTERTDKPVLRSQVKQKQKSSSKPTGSGQMSLDSFVMKQR